MREVTINATFDSDVLARVQPGDYVTIRCFVSQVTVQSIDTSTYAGEHHVLPGERTVSLVVESAALEAAPL